MQVDPCKKERMAPSWYKRDEISLRYKAQKLLIDTDRAYTLQWDEFPLIHTITPKTQQLSKKHWGMWGVSSAKLIQQHDGTHQDKTHRRHTGWVELGLLNLKKEGTTAVLSLNYLFLVTGNAERTSFAWRKTVISYKEKKITMRRCSTEKVAQQFVPLEIFRMELEKAFLWLGNYLLWEGAWTILPERPIQT